jgi:TldD protein
MIGNTAKETVEAALDAARGQGAAYADARAATYREQDVHAEDRRIDHIGDGESAGLGVRVVVNGSWGFAASSEISAAAAETAARMAVEVARASASLRKGPPVALAEEPPHRDRYESRRRIDPFETPVNRKVEILLAAHEEMLHVTGVKKALSAIFSRRETKTYANTDGSLIELDLVTTGCSISATAVDGGDARSRQYEPPILMRGFEVVEEAGLVGHARRVGEEAVEKLHAPPVAGGEYDLILLPSHLWLTIHESVGHATELDRVLGMEESLSGGSFASLDQLGKLRYGSSLINFRALDARPGLLASVGYDDDGVTCQDWDIVREGILVGYTTNREVARAMGEARSRGSCRADSWASIPILRMPNVSLMAGRDRLSVDDLIADTKHGILIDGDGSFSIDQKRLNFQFGGDAFWLIENGRRARMVRDVTYHAITPEFWNSCDAVCDEREWRPFGAVTCGKGDPMQTAQMTQGSAPARFRRIKVRRAE